MPQPTAEQVRILDALVTHARPVILSRFRADSCIASTRIGIDVLDYFGITGREVPLLVAVFNREAVQMVSDGVPMSEIKARTEQIGTDEPSGPWTLGMGATPRGEWRPDGWSGHLVIGVPGLGVVIDLSADQSSRPHKGIVLEPYWAPIRDENWFTDPKAQEFLLNAETGVLLVLDRSAVTDPTGYVRSSNWWRRSEGEPGLYRRLTGQIVRAIKADLES